MRSAEAPRCRGTSTRESRCRPPVLSERSSRSAGSSASRGGYGADVAPSLGVTENLLHAWKRKYRSAAEEVRRECGGETAEEELERLRREITRRLSAADASSAQDSRSAHVCVLQDRRGLRNTDARSSPSSSLTRGPCKRRDNYPGIGGGGKRGDYVARGRETSGPRPPKERSPMNEPEVRACCRTERGGSVSSRRRAQVQPKPRGVTWRERGLAQRATARALRKFVRCADSEPTRAGGRCNRREDCLGKVSQWLPGRRGRREL
jgi:transposase-like protein